MPKISTPLTAIPRHAETRLCAAMADTRIVALLGPRQSGKTTLARKVAADLNLHFVTLDDGQFRRFANHDPDGFMRGLDRAVIDEIQRAPALILALKKTVDEDPRPGRFLITGSVDLFRGAISPDSLAGRVETVELLPFSQAEIGRHKASGFLRHAFAGDFPALKASGRTADLIARVIAGGYPEALTRTTPVRRRVWLAAYARALTTRDVVEIAEVAKTAELSRLLKHAAVAAGQTLNLSALAGALGVDGKTVERWLTLLEQMFLIRRVPAWHRNDLKRLIKAPKLHFIDSGLLAALQRVSEGAIQGERSRLGPLLEGFVFSELVKLIGQSEDAVSLSHFRDRDRVEVDFVLEQAGKIVGIEVKATATLKPRDCHGLQRLQGVAGRAFACGVILHDSERIQRVGDRLFAMPVASLWAESERL